MVHAFSKARPVVAKTLVKKLKATEAGLLLGGKLGDTQDRVVAVGCVQECAVTSEWVALGDNLELSRSIRSPDDFILVGGLGLA
jgi:hypothetical protein